MINRSSLNLAFASFILGAVLTFFYIEHSDPMPQMSALNKSTTDKGINSDQERQKGESADKQNNENMIKRDYQSILSEKEKLIEQLNQQIVDLNQQIANHAIDSETNIKNEDSVPLKKMDMADFESLTKETFIDKFKGVVLSISGRQLESFKSVFETTIDQDEKSIAYQNQISDYLLNSNPYSEHYVDDIRCQADICRLEVSTSNEESWNQIYANMTRQDWYTSITFEEESEFPGRHIYYLPNIDN